MGEYWPNHPPPSNYPGMKGYEAWVNEFRPCVGAECERRAGAGHVKQRGRHAAMEGGKRGMHMEEEDEEEMGGSQDRYASSQFAQSQGYNPLGPRTSSQSSGYEYERQGSTSPHHTQASMDGNRQMDFERSGAYTHPNYSMDANRQAGYASESDRHRHSFLFPCNDPLMSQDKSALTLNDNLLLILLINNKDSMRGMLVDMPVMVIKRIMDMHMIIPLILFNQLVEDAQVIIHHVHVNRIHLNQSIDNLVNHLAHPPLHPLPPSSMDIMLNWVLSIALTHRVMDNSNMVQVVR